MWVNGTMKLFEELANCILLCVNEYDYMEMGFVSPTP